MGTWIKQNVEIMAGFGEVFCKEMPDQLYLVASGTSYHGAKAAGAFMELVLGRQVNVFPPSRLNHIFGKNPLLIFISQGGKSTNMLAAAKRLTGYTRIAMTGNVDGKLNHMCEHYIRIPCGQENVGLRQKVIRLLCSCFI